MAAHGLIYATTFHHGSTTFMAAEGWDTSGLSINTSVYHTEDGVGEPHACNVSGTTQTGRTPTWTDPQRVAFWLAPQTGTPDHAGFCFEQGASTQVYLRFQTDGTVKVTRGDEVFGTLLATSPALLNRSVGNWVAIRLVADNAGTLEIAINGVSVYTYTDDLQATGSPGWTRIRLRTATENASHVIDNLLVFDSSESWLPGPQVAQVRQPTSVVSGTLTGSASTGSSRWQNVDDQGAGGTDYNEAAAAGDGDRYGAGSLSGVGEVLAVVVQAEAERAGSITALELGVNSNGTADYAAPVALPSSGVGVVTAVWEEDPAAAAAWTPARASAADLLARFAA